MAAVLLILVAGMPRSPSPSASRSSLRRTRRTKAALAIAAAFYSLPGFKKPVVLFKTGTVTQKNYFCIFRFRSLKYKKPDPVYHLGPDRKREKIPKTGGYRTGSETLLSSPSCVCRWSLLAASSTLRKLNGLHIPADNRSFDNACFGGLFTAPHIYSDVRSPSPLDSSSERPRRFLPLPGCVSGDEDAKTSALFM